VKTAEKSAREKYLIEHPELASEKESEKTEKGKKKRRVTGPITIL
jgi:hypothetical protein